MSDAKRFEDWIISDAHEFQYPDGESMSEDAFAFQLELQDLRAKWESVPWDAIEECAEWPKIERPELSQVIWDWMDGKAPRQHLSDEQAAALVELLRRA